MFRISTSSFVRDANLAAPPPDSEGAERSKPGTFHSHASLSRQHSAGGTLAQCIETCAQRRSQTIQALISGRLPPSYHQHSTSEASSSIRRPGKLPCLTSDSKTPKSSVFGRSEEDDADISTAKSRSALLDTRAGSVARGVDSRDVAATSHHRVIRMLASEQGQLPSASNTRQDLVRVARLDTAAQVRFSAVQKFEFLPGSGHHACHA